MATPDLFDLGEALADDLNAIAGCEDALIAVLDPVLAQAPDRGRSVLALVAAIGRFRASAEARASTVTRMGFHA